jgi:hypothetical protein
LRRLDGDKTAPTVTDALPQALRDQCPGQQDRIQQPHGAYTATGREYSYFYHRPSCNTRNPAIDHIGWFGIMTLLGTVRVFAGPQWQPSEIGVMTQQAPCRSIRERFPGTHMRSSQQYSYIAVENALLSRPPLTLEADTSGQSPFTYDSFENNFVGSLKQALLAYIQEEDLSIEVAADLCNLSKHSLKEA